MDPVLREDLIRPAFVDSLPFSRGPWDVGAENPIRPAITDLGDSRDHQFESPRAFPLGAVPGCRLG